MRIVISNNSSVPIYEQIKDQIKAGILSGELTESEALPSIRQLARDLQVSVITPTRAYNDLELEGYIQTVPGKGCYVKRPNQSAIVDHCLQEVRAALKKVWNQCKIAGVPITELHKIIDELEETSHDECH